MQPKCVSATRGGDGLARPFRTLNLGAEDRREDSRQGCLYQGVFLADLGPDRHHVETSSQTISPRPVPLHCCRGERRTDCTSWRRSGRTETERKGRCQKSYLDLCALQVRRP